MRRRAFLLAGTIFPAAVATSLTSYRQAFAASGDDKPEGIVVFEGAENSTFQRLIIALKREWVLS